MKDDCKKMSVEKNFQGRHIIPVVLFKRKKAKPILWNIKDNPRKIIENKIFKGRQTTFVAFFVRKKKNKKKSQFLKDEGRPLEN